ncbi:MAG: hypothetical protein AB7N69_11835 [Immundisolibacter sp.]|uniref:hypothetical protein n=1 Tax=Immundisolibacter sp. TaxID=1934948 RepID=UPI003D0FC137
MDRDEKAQQRRGRWMLIALAALFLGPLLFSWGYQKLGFTAYPAPKLAGVLIEPPKPLPVAGRAGWPDRRWTLVVAGPCDAACWKTLIDLRQIVRSLPRYQDRMARAYVHAPGAQLGAERVQELDGVHAVEDADGALLDAIESAAPAQETAFAMVDPAGYAMLRYRRDYDARAARKDIEHLLRRLASN